LGAANVQTGETAGQTNLDGAFSVRPTVRLDVLDEFLAERRAKHCSDDDPPPSEVIGVAALPHPDLVIAIVAVATLPD